MAKSNKNQRRFFFLFLLQRLQTGFCSVFVFLAAMANVTFELAVEASEPRTAHSVRA